MACPPKFKDTLSLPDGERCVAGGVCAGTRLPCAGSKPCPASLAVRRDAVRVLGEEADPVLLLNGWLNIWLLLGTMYGASGEGSWLAEDGLLGGVMASVLWDEKERAAFCKPWELCKPLLLCKPLWLCKPGVGIRLAG